MLRFKEHIALYFRMITPVCCAGNRMKGCDNKLRGKLEGCCSNLGEKSCWRLGLGWWQGRRGIYSEGKTKRIFWPTKYEV